MNLKDTTKKHRMTKDEYTQGVDDWADSAYRFAMRCGGTEETSKDAVQEAFATLWEQRSKVTFDKGRAFVLTVVHRQVANHYRHQQKVTPMPQNTACEPAEDTKAEQFDMRNIVAQCMDQLLPQQRAILQLRDADGLSYKEIGNILSLSDQQVMVYIYRARVAMKKQLLAFGIESMEQII